MCMRGKEWPGMCLDGGRMMAMTRKCNQLQSG